MSRLDSAIRESVGVYQASPADDIIRRFPRPAARLGFDAYVAPEFSMSRVPVHLGAGRSSRPAVVLRAASKR